MARCARVAAWLWLLAGANAWAGITLHFEGTAANAGAVARVVDTVAAQAERRGWRYQRVGGGEVATLDATTLRLLQAAQGAEDLDDLRGIVVYPHEMSEPLYLVFGSKLRTKNFVKTQFAGADVHIALIELLEAVKPLFADLEVDDEGEYWSTHDRARLDQRLAAAASAMGALHAKMPDARGPVKRPDGRIVDLVR